MRGHGSLESGWLVWGQVDIAQAVDRSGNADGDASEQHARGGEDVEAHGSGLPAVWYDLAGSFLRGLRGKAE